MITHFLKPHSLANTNITPQNPQEILPSAAFPQQAAYQSTSQENRSASSSPPP